MGNSKLKGIRILAGMDAASLDALLEYGEIVEYATGDLIVMQGEKANAMFFLLQGKAGAYFSDPDGSEIHLRTMDDGDHFGEIGLLENGIRTANVKALEPCTLFRLDTRSFKKLLATPALATKFLHGLGRSLAIRLAAITSRFAEERALKEHLRRHSWL